ncbi:MAG: outer membrane protein assembly factor BamD [candidate division WOR-3 bacterium]|nr:MAG: outer membrane protein assembly factor BamD [candidate division WOR-3 bacterium]
MRPILIFCPVLVLTLSCAPRETLTPLEPAEEFQRARSLYDAKKYESAVAAFERILFYHPSSEFVDDAQYWLGRTYLERKEYDQAIVEFDYLLRHFPNSPQLEEAFFYRAKAHLLAAPDYEKDLGNLRKAIRVFDEFLTRYPNSEHTEEVRKEILTARNRLAKKELENGKLYEKLKEPEAALLYYEYIMSNYPETESAAEAAYRAAQIHEKQDQVGAALELYKGLLDDDRWREEASERIAELEKNNEESSD